MILSLQTNINLNIEFSYLEEMMIIEK
jgi:hypothetical protein